MNYELTPERQAYLDATGLVVLNACPGSGKTTTIAQKLTQLTQNWEKVHGNYCGIACLSFTNVAKNEIFEKYRNTCGFPLTYPHLISTIDSFINVHITLPFAHKIIQTTKRFRIIDDISYINELFTKNFAFIKEHKALMFRFVPSKIDYTIDGGFSWDGHDKSGEADFVAYAKAVKRIQLGAGLIKSSDSAFIALHLLKKHSEVAKYLSARFPHLIIDEAQDTSEIQHAIIDELQKAGLRNIELVGDPYQCLYEWRNASPALFLAKFGHADWKGLNLSENRRSTQKIVSAFDTLRKTGGTGLTAKTNTEDDLPVHFLKYSASHAGIIAKYELLCTVNGLKDNRVLVRGNSLKSALLGVPQEFQPWNQDIPYQVVEAKVSLEKNEVKNAVNAFRKVALALTGPNLDFQEMKLMEEEKVDDFEFNAFIFEILRGLPSFDLSGTDWTTQSEEYLTAKLSLQTKLDFKIKKRNSSKFDKSLLALPMNSFFKRAATSNALPIETIHQIKGATLDSVMLILSENSTGQNVSFNEFTSIGEIPNEKQRLIYVAMSRPRSLLCIGVPVSVNDESLREKFGADIKIINEGE